MANPLPDHDTYLNPTQAAAFLGCSVRTLRWYTKTGKLTDRRSTGGQRRFQLAELRAFRGDPVAPAGVVLYARVSSRRQKDEGDLDRQVERLEQLAEASGKRVVATYRDVASGLSDTRRGFLAALRKCAGQDVTELWVTHPDRLARFGRGGLEVLLSELGVTVCYVDESEDNAAAEGELVKDMLSIVTSFSGRLYGQRSVKSRKLRQALQEGVAS